MKKRQILTLLGFLLFLIGMVGIAVELIGLPFALTDWINYLFGRTFGFFFKLLLTMGGIVMAIAVNQRSEDTYDEYFDGEKYE